MTLKMETVKCKKCDRKIAEAEGTDIKLSIKCPRCGSINQITIVIQKAAEPLCSAPRAPDIGGSDNVQSQTNYSVDRR